MEEAQVQEFQRDGVLVIRNLLDAHQVQRLNEAMDSAPKPLSILDIVFAVKRKEPSYADIRFDVWRTDATIARLALETLPPFVAPLMQQNKATDETKDQPHDDRFRLLRDAYFAYQEGGRGCGWHVDDPGFWPTAPDTGGITVWIALTDMPDDNMGGLALANQTQLDEETLATCRKAIQGNTCGMETSAPDCHQKLEDARVNFGTLKAGDALIWDRWVFHRTLSTNSTTEPNIAAKRRYSVRYIPGHARAQGALHESVPQGGQFNGSPYYPQVWPKLIDTEVNALQQGLASDMSPVNMFHVVRRLLLDKIFGSEKQT